MAGLTSELVSNAAGLTTLVPVNCPRAVEFRNAYFEGRVVFFHREISDSHAQYFASKRRFWELRWQGRFLQPPSSEVFIGAELRRPLPEHHFLLAILARSSLKFAQSVAAARGASLVSNYGEEEISDRHHMLFPLSAADVKIASDSQSSAPDITAPVDLVSDGNFDEEISVRKIYTFAFYTMYADLANWCFANFPIISGKSLALFVGEQPIYAVMREGEKSQGARYLLQISFTHDLRSPAFESAISDPDDQVALLDLPSLEHPRRNLSRRGLRRNFFRLFECCWSGVKRLISRFSCCVD